MVEGNEAAESWLVVINDEEQYSIWPADRPVPAGWREVGLRGVRDWCLDQIATMWSDMRPLSVRKALKKSE
jgi:MbtH protein